MNPGGYLARKLSPVNFADPRPIVDLTDRQASQYSICRALEALVDKQSDTFEMEISDEIQQRTGRLPSGFGRSMFVPTRLQARAGLDSLTNSAGGYAIQTDVVPQLVELLRAQTRVIQLGGRFLEGLRGNVNFVTEATPTQANFVSDDPGADNADTDPSFGVRTTLSPKMLTATLSARRKLIAQSSIAVETMLRKEIAKTHAIAIDGAAINGSGSANQPLGILGTAGITTVPLGTNGAAPTYAGIVALEEALLLANVDEGSVGVLTNPKVKAALRQTYINAGSLPVWGKFGLLDYQSLVSTNCPSNLTKGTGSSLSAIIMADWSNLVIGEWGAFEIIVDPFTSKKKAMIEFASYQMVDVGLLRPTAFAVAVDAIAS
jgi:HK97 family phage major capsid protein